MPEQKTILITGGAGFIGSNLAKKLLVQGHKVIVMDNFFTGSKKNLESFKNDNNFVLFEYDVINKLPDMKVDQIYHLACPASPPQYQKNPVETVRTNVSGSINALELAKKYQARILFSSTSEIYGDPKVHPQTEEYWGNVNPIGPRSCYDEGKRCAETLFFDYHREYGIDIRVIRIFNTFGPNMAGDDGRVVTNFIIQALENKLITIYGEGQQTRSFMYVDDLVEGMIKFMNTDGFVGPINIGNPQEITIKELAEEIIKQTGSSSKLVYKPLPENDPVRRKPDISLAKEKIDWQPQIDWQDGLKKTIAYWQDKLK